MTFADILQQVLELLQSRGRVSYRALSTAFDLDDESIKELQAEIIQVRQLASDEDGVALVWRPAAAPLDSIDLSGVTPRSVIAERRQLTVLCCDLIGVTALSKHMPPDDVQTILHAYQVASDAVIDRFGGYPARHGRRYLCVYFGYPQAHEDDAQRAIRTGLGLVEAIARLNPQLQQDTRLRLALRIGIHTDLAVVSNPKHGMGSEPVAVGDALYTATHLSS